MGQDKSTTRKNTGFTAEEKAAMKERARELKAEARASRDKAEGESNVLAKHCRDAGTGSHDGQADP